jgi:hypothetical protein
MWNSNNLFAFHELWNLKLIILTKSLKFLSDIWHNSTYYELGHSFGGVIMGHRCGCKPRCGCGCEPVCRPRCGDGFGFGGGFGFGDSWWPLLLLSAVGRRGRRRWF